MDIVLEVITAITGATQLISMVQQFIAASQAGTDPTTVIPTVVANILTELGLVSTGGQATTVAELEALLAPISADLTAIIKFIQSVTPTPTPTPAPVPAPAPAPAPKAA